MAAFDFTYDQKYDLVLNGFDVKVMQSDQGAAYFFVEVYEEGELVYSIDLPIPEQQEGQHPEEIVNDVAQAAIDIFESERGTLGQGAGAMVAKKAFTWEINDHMEWYMSFKGTPYEDPAYQLLQDLYALDLEKDSINDRSEALHDELHEIEYKLKHLNLERMRDVPPGAQIIIIQGALKSGSWFGDAQELQEFMDLFCGDPREAEVIKLMDRYLDIKQELNKQDENWDAFYEQESAIRNQMDSLSLESLQQNVIDKLPTEGIDAFPEMASDLVDLMEGVSMDEPLEAWDESMGGESGREPMTPNEFMTMASKKALEEVEPVEKRIVEKGDVHDGLSEFSQDDLPFQKGDSVVMSKKWEGSTTGGCLLVVDKGEKGTIENVFDGHGDCFMVAFDNGMLLKMHKSFLSNA